MSCKRAQGFLAKEAVTVGATVDAKKQPRSERDAFALLADVDVIVAAKGKNVVTLDLKTKPTRDEIRAVLLGPTGNLRAPTLRKGRTLLVGFNDETYRRVLKQLRSTT